MSKVRPPVVVPRLFAWTCPPWQWPLVLFDLSLRPFSMENYTTGVIGPRRFGPIASGLFLEEHRANEDGISWGNSLGAGIGVFVQV